LFNIEILKYDYVFRYSSWIEGEMNSEEREGYLSFDGSMVDDVTHEVGGFSSAKYWSYGPNPDSDLKKRALVMSPLIRHSCCRLYNLLHHGEN
jgi:hypothetical protein